jgi:hypothetical protein
MNWVLFAMIISGGTFLVYETTHFVMAQGLPVFLAFLVALTLESFCVLASAYKSRIIVYCFVVLVLFASSYNRLSPILDDDGMSRAQTLRVEALNSSVASLERQLEIFNEQRQPKNSARVSRELKEKLAERDAAIAAISSAPMAALNIATIAGNIVGIIFLRLFVQICNIYCAEKLGERIFKPKKKQATSHHVLEKTAKFIRDKGEINRQKLLESKQLTAADAVDLSTDLLAAMGHIEIKTNGKKANTLYLG